ncbi:MAG: hypothetical protein PHI85_05465 [Victivallaceae bacterium]|nr:hypothetical protein [Victivallaceae bacterium]
MRIVWSKSRADCLERCRREFFLRYLRRPDEAESREDRLIAGLRALTRLEDRIYRRLREILRTAESPSAASDELWRRWLIDRAAAPETFTELYFGTESFPDFAGRGNRLVREVALNLKKRRPQLWGDRESRLPLETPLGFTLGDIQIYTAPFALAAADGKVIFLQLAEKRCELTAALLRFYALNALRIEPDRCECRFFNPFTGTVEAPALDVMNFTSVCDTVGTEAEKIASFQTSEVVCTNAFAAIHPQREQCHFCVFKSVCFP